jgi:hypothetical protein
LRMALILQGSTRKISALKIYEIRRFSFRFIVLKFKAPFFDSMTNKTGVLNSSLSRPQHVSFRLSFLNEFFTSSTHV